MRIIYLSQQKRRKNVAWGEVTGSSAMLQMRALAREFGHSLKRAEKRWLVFCDMCLSALITAVDAPRIAMSSE